jgi:hypothetical protein
LNKPKVALRRQPKVREKLKDGIMSELFTTKIDPTAEVVIQKDDTISKIWLLLLNRAKPLHLEHFLPPIFCLFLFTPFVAADDWPATFLCKSMNHR